MSYGKSDPHARYSDMLWKHKYALALDKSLQPMLDAMSKPYPKRPKDSSEPPGDLPGEGGAAPTRTLCDVKEVND